jgi:DNA-binding transcriptional ArsR family regulator
VHLVPADRAGRRIIDQERVCDAIAAIRDPAAITAWAQRFALLGEPNRLAILRAIATAGPISVTDLAVATNINDTGVSQTLRLLRATGTVTAQRDGRVLRYHITDLHIQDLLRHIDTN